MTMLALGSAIAGGVSSIFGGKAQSAAAALRNQQAIQQWVQDTTNKTFANAKEQFNSAYQFTQQAKRNSAIAEAAYATQFEATQNLKDMASFQQRQLYRQRSQASAALSNALLSRGISSSSGVYNALAASQAMDAFNNSQQLQKNLAIQKNNIDKEFKAQMSAQTSNIFMPNIQGYSQSPTLEDASAAGRGGMISGILQIGSAFGAAGLGAMGQPGSSVTVPETSPDFVGPPSWAAGS